MSRIVPPSNAKMPKLTKRTRCRSLGSPGSSHSKRSSWTTAADALSQTAIFFEASMHASTGIPMVSHTSWSSRRSRRRCSARGFPRRLRRGFGGQLPQRFGHVQRSREPRVRFRLSIQPRSSARRARTTGNGEFWRALQLSGANFLRRLTLF
jgi:hypothetical protein